MAEGNGSERLDRIEALVEKVATMGYLHDERLSRFEANVERMQEDEASYRKEQREREKRMEERIAAEREEQREREKRIDDRAKDALTDSPFILGARNQWL